MIKITGVYSNFEREPLSAPFGFKGGYLSEVWQTAAGLVSENGSRGIGIGTQSPLWSDSDVFASHSEAAGNAIMFLMTEFAVNEAKKIKFSSPPELLDALLPRVYAFGKKIAGNDSLRETFALNSLVPVDNAAWLVYTAENSIKTFDEMIPHEFTAVLSKRHDKLASIPLISYGVPAPDIKQALEDGYFMLKIKIGSDPEKDGDLDKMLDWDKKRLASIHEIAADYSTPHTESGRIPYYLDANGRYEGRDRLMRLLEHAEKIGALEDILIVEEPFPEELKIKVDDIPARLAADESAHTEKDAEERMELGYGAIALKPIAKTLTVSLRIAALAKKNNIPCFCADLTVNPILVDWNKNFAARLPSFPGLKTGLLETNGHQNYLNWEKMKTFHPLNGREWMKTEKGIFHLEDDFFSESGGIFQESPHYMKLLGM
jgi:hypothetical protein